MNTTPYEPEGATVLWDCVVGDRVDRIIAVDTHHPTTVRRLTMVRNHLVIEQCEKLHSHSFWHEMPRDRAGQLVYGHRYGLVGHTVFDLEPAKNIHRLWPAAHDFAEHRFGFHSVHTMVQAHELVDTDRMTVAIQRAYDADGSQRVRFADLEVPA